MKEKISTYGVPVLALLGLIVAGIISFFGNKELGQLVLQVTLVLGVLPLLYSMVRSLLSGYFGVDLVAVAAIVLSYFLQEYLAGTVIVLMMSGGEALESYALKRASNELTQLLSRAPSIAHIKKGETVTDLGAQLVQVGDILVIKPGETVPVDGIVLEGSSDVDESSMTGESALVVKDAHTYISSGSTNKTGVLTVRALRLAKESQYERIVMLVKQAQESRAPIVRLADRYAVWFTVLTFLIASLAWFFTGDIGRFLAVLVVATPCPLILATPIAVMSGISWAASRGIIVKNGGSLELLGEARSFVFDKTGTLTFGIPRVLGVEAKNISETNVLFIAASLDQLSAHVLARSLVRYARKELSQELKYPQQFFEKLAQGVYGEIDGVVYTLGKLAFVKERGVVIGSWWQERHQQLQEQGVTTIYLADEKEIVGCIKFSDQLRAETKSVFHSMRSQGIQRLVMLTGDKKLVAEKVAQDAGITEFEAELLPEQKVVVLEKIKKENGPVVMVGDGVNDAPALAAADVGIAMAVHGSSAASDAGDVVIMVNDFERVAEALHIGRRVLTIAKQSIIAGIGVSVILMIIAAFGFIRPVVGALLQEVIDVAVIVNALRVHFAKKRFLRGK